MGMMRNQPPNPKICSAQRDKTYAKFPKPDGLLTLILQRFEDRHLLPILKNSPIIFD
jgi:hypothetical protein